MARIGTFKALLKEVVVFEYGCHSDGKSYQFELILSVPKSKKNYFWT